jgi:hypothetical protein
MQIDYVASTKVRWQDPETNIREGARILKKKLAFLAASPGKPLVVTAKEAARLGVQPGSYPDPRPLRGQALIEAGIAAYNTGEGNVLQNLAVGRAPDVTTSGGNYSRNVLATAASALSTFTRSLT